MVRNTHTLPADLVQRLVYRSVKQQSNPTRSSPLPYMYKITNTYDTTPLRNAVTPKASLSRLSWVLSFPELHQHLVWDCLIPHSRRWVNVGKLRTTRFQSKGSRSRFAFLDVPDTVYTWKPKKFVSRSRGNPCSEISQFPSSRPL